MPKKRFMLHDMIHLYLFCFSLKYELFQRHYQEVTLQNFTSCERTHGKILYDDYMCNEL